MQNCKSKIEGMNSGTQEDTIINRIHQYLDDILFHFCFADRTMEIEAAILNIV